MKEVHGRGWALLAASPLLTYRYAAGDAVLAVGVRTEPA